MPAKKKTLTKHVGGRPTKFRSEYAAITERLCFRGCTLQEIGEVLGVGQATIQRWKEAHSEFRSALKAREEADAKVVQSLYQAALNGNVTAQIYWLKNRCPAKWRDKQDIDVSGNVVLFQTKPLKERGSGSS